jgi:type IV pilus assembly protein PilA
MKSQFKAKLVNHLLNRKNAEKGFTLIELLVVIIIIGILAAIALPSFLNQANKARQSEAKNYVGSLNRAQQAYYLEKAQFSATIDRLGLGISTTTDNYFYTLSTALAGSTLAGPLQPVATAPLFNGPQLVNAYGSPKKAALKGYAGVTWLGSTGTEATTTTALFESITASPLTPQATIVNGIALAAVPAGTSAPTPAGMDAIK